MILANDLTTKESSSKRPEHSTEACKEELTSGVKQGEAATPIIVVNGK